MKAYNTLSISTESGCNVQKESKSDAKSYILSRKQDLQNSFDDHKLMFGRTVRYISAVHDDLSVTYTPPRSLICVKSIADD